MDSGEDKIEPSPSRAGLGKRPYTDSRGCLAIAQ